MTNIFISHSTETKETARKLSNHLRNAGAKVWLDEEQLLPGDSIASEISKAIKSSDAVLFLISDSHSKNRWLSSEVASAMAQGKRILPIILDRKAELPIILQDRLYLDISEQQDIGTAAMKIMQSLSRPVDEDNEISSRVQLVQAEQAQLEHEQRCLTQLKKRQEVEIRSMAFSVIFVTFSCLTAILLFYFLQPRSNEFDFLWSIIFTLFGGAAVEVGHYVRSKIQVKNLGREVQ